MRHVPRVLLLIVLAGIVFVLMVGPALAAPALPMEVIKITPDPRGHAPNSTFTPGRVSFENGAPPIVEPPIRVTVLDPL